MVFSYEIKEILKMNIKPEEVVTLIKSKGTAQKVIAELIMKFTSDTAAKRLKDEKVFAHQTTKEMAMRTAGNVLDSLVVRKPGGFVE